MRIKLQPWYYDQGNREQLLIHVKQHMTSVRVKYTLIGQDREKLHEAKNSFTGQLCDIAINILK